MLEGYKKSSELCVLHITVHKHYIEAFIPRTKRNQRVVIFMLLLKYPQRFLSTSSLPLFPVCIFLSMNKCLCVNKIIS